MKSSTRLNLCVNGVLCCFALLIGLGICATHRIHKQDSPPACRCAPCDGCCEHPAGDWHGEPTDDRNPCTFPPAPEPEPLDEFLPIPQRSL